MTNNEHLQQLYLVTLPIYILKYTMYIANFPFSYYIHSLQIYSQYYSGCLNEVKYRKHLFVAFNMKTTACQSVGKA